MNNKTISICIPAYKHTAFLKRLLNSVAIQTYKDFEVIITDDSPGNDVEKLCRKYENNFRLLYFKNESNLNTPENWNEAIRKASGDWIKLMHDDDWFAAENTLQKYSDAVLQHPDCNFFFSAYTNVYQETGKVRSMFLSALSKKKLAKTPAVLIAENVIGPPSVTLYKNNKKYWYDNRMKYVVDIDFYIQYLNSSRFLYLNSPLINVGINKAQVTQYTFGVADVQLKESLLLIEKTGAQELKNIMVFDGWWRLIRNFSIKNIEDIRTTGYNGYIPDVLLKMIKFQKRIPYSVLKTGILSKVLMMLCYIKIYSLKSKYQQ
jgi:glycosyltransferase involved in cell wall biosynthesis